MIWFFDLKLLNDHIYLVFFSQEGFVSKYNGSLKLNNYFYLIIQVVPASSEWSFHCQSPPPRSGSGCRGSPWSTHPKKNIFFGSIFYCRKQINSAQRLVWFPSFPSSSGGNNSKKYKIPIKLKICLVFLFTKNCVVLYCQNVNFLYFQL